MKLGTVCPTCAGPTERDARFCRHCGAPLPPLIEPTLGSAATGKSGGKALGPASCEGERKQATVLCADVQGSTGLSEQMEPEEWHRVIGGFFTILGDAVRAFGGTVSRFTGDGLMAVFGAPVALEDHAQRACRAALRARRELALYADDIRRRHGLGFSVRIGLDSGEVVAAPIGWHGEGEYTALGRTVSLAESVERLAEPGRILVTQSTAALVGGYFELLDLGSFGIPGYPGPLRVHELRGLGVWRSRFDVARARGLSRLVGRHDELARLERALGRTEPGRGQIVCVVGEPGMGKSRLCWELVDRCARRDWQVFTWRVASHHATASVLGLVEDLGQAIETGARGSQVELWDRLGERLRESGVDPKQLLPMLLEVVSEGKALKRDAGARPLALHELAGMIDLAVRAVGRRGPTLVLIEDLHSLDATGERLLEIALAAVRSSRIMALLNFRPEYRLPEAVGAAVERIELLPLGGSHAADLLREWLGDDPRVRGLEAQILARAGGNPFFLEEIVWSLVETGTLEGERGDYRPRGSGAEPVTLPGTLRAALAARIDRLPALDKHVLQTAAVIGHEFSARLLCRVLRRAEGGLDEQIARLLDAHLLEVRCAAGRESLSLRHPLVLEAAYDAQLGEARARIHARVARSLAELDPQRGDERAGRIAYHWERAGRLAEAVQWVHRSARWSSVRSVPEALRAWRKVRTLTQELPPTPETQRLSLEAAIAILAIGARAGLGEEEAQRHFDEGWELALGGGDVTAQAELLRAFALVHVLAGETRRGVELAERAVDIVPDTFGTWPARAARVSLAFTYATAGRLRDVCAVARRTLQPWPMDDPGPARLVEGEADALLLQLHAWASIETGHVAEARRELDLVVEVAQRQGLLAVLCLAFGSWPALARCGAVNVEEALALGQRALEAAESLASPFLTVVATWALGSVHLLHGGWEEAEQRLAAALDLARERRVGLYLESSMLASLAEAAAGRGELYECEALLVLARALLSRGGGAAHAAATAALARAELQVRAQGLVGLAPRVHLANADLARALGREAHAAAERRAARAAFVAIGADALAARLAEPQPHRAAS